MNKIKYYIIHCNEHIERIVHMNNISKILNDTLINFKGYYTKNVSTDYKNKIEFLKSIDSNLNMNKNTLSKSGEIGCYLSHHMLIKELSERYEPGFSIIFEDDVVFNNNIENEINVIINNLEKINSDWDIVFLGNITKNHKDLLIDNIYTIDINNCCTGTHALLFNNKNLDKIYKSNCNILHAIDWQYKINIDKKILNGYVIYPPICYQNKNLGSNIQ